jgi:hypothetical protein
VPWFFSFKFWLGGGWGFFSFFLCSQHAPIMFSMDSQQVLSIFHRYPIVAHFNPICFAQSPLLLTYIGEPKWEALHLLFQGASIVSIFFVMGQTNWLIAEKNKSWTCEHCQLINMKQNKYPLGGDWGGQWLLIEGYLDYCSLR